MRDYEKDLPALAAAMGAHKADTAPGRAAGLALYAAMSAALDAGVSQAQVSKLTGQPWPRRLLASARFRPETHEQIAVLKRVRAAVKAEADLLPQLADVTQRLLTRVEVEGAAGTFTNGELAELLGYSTARAVATIRFTGRTGLPVRRLGAGGRRGGPPEVLAAYPSLPDLPAPAPDRDTALTMIRELVAQRDALRSALERRQVRIRALVVQAVRLGVSQALLDAAGVGSGRQRTARQIVASERER